MNSASATDADCVGCGGVWKGVERCGEVWMVWTDVDGVQGVVGRGVSEGMNSASGAGATACMRARMRVRCAWAGRREVGVTRARRGHSSGMGDGGWAEAGDVICCEGKAEEGDGRRGGGVRMRNGSGREGGGGGGWRSHVEVVISEGADEGRHRHVQRVDVPVVGGCQLDV
jgi:hypothetical protein